VRSRLNEAVTSFKYASLDLVTFRHRRGQQQLLPATFRGRVRTVALYHAGEFPLLGEGQPLSHAYEEAQRSGSGRREVLHARRFAQREARAGSVSTAAELRGKSPASGRISRCPSARESLCVRVPQPELEPSGGSSPSARA